MTEITTNHILDRDVSRAAVETYRKQAAPVLAKLVDAGIAAFERCSSSAMGKDENLGILFPALHVFEMLDGVDVLLRDAAVIPSRPLLRAAFEAKLTVEYVTEADSARRGAAYVVEEVHKRIQGIKRFDGSSQAAKQFRAELAADRFGAGIKLPELPDAATRVEGLERLLNMEHLREPAIERERLKSRRNGEPPFYSHWNGPSNVQQLARYLGNGGQYEVLYRTWSRTAHGFDLGRQLTGTDGVAAIGVFRNPEEIHNSYSLAISFGLSTMRAMLSHYRPSEIESGSFARWYAREIRQVYQALDVQAPEARTRRDA
jgi:hypothetical protein